jgi:hypothetical protein
MLAPYLLRVRVGARPSLYSVVNAYAHQFIRLPRMACAFIDHVLTPCASTQSLDEIKLLKLINAAGDADEHRVLRLLDGFYWKARAARMYQWYAISSVSTRCGPCVDRERTPY